MTWQTIPDVVAGQVLTARYLNKYGEDNLRFLHAARAARVTATTQNINFGTWTAITFDAQTWDTHEFWLSTLPTRLTVPTGLDGRYAVEAGLDWESSVNGDRAFGVRVNGGTRYDMKRWESTLTINSETGNVVLNLNAGDYLELMVWHSGPATIDGGLDANTLFLGLKHLGDTV